VGVQPNSRHRDHSRLSCRAGGYAAQAKCQHPVGILAHALVKICIAEMTRELPRFLPIQRCSGGKTSNTIASLRWTFVAKRASQIILLKRRTDVRDPAEFWQPLVHGADGVFGRHSRWDAALGNPVRNSNWLLGSRFSRSRCWYWLGYHYRIGNRLRNVEGFRAGLMATNHARPP